MFALNGASAAVLCLTAPAGMLEARRGVGRTELPQPRGAGQQDPRSCPEALFFYVTAYATFAKTAVCSKY